MLRYGLLFLLMVGGCVFPKLSTSDREIKQRPIKNRHALFVRELPSGLEVEDYISLFQVDGGIRDWFPFTAEEYVARLLKDALLSEGYSIVPREEGAPSLLYRIDEFTFKFRADRIYSEEKGYDYYVDYRYRVSMEIRIKLPEDTLRKYQFVSEDEGSYNVYFMREVFASLYEELDRSVSSIVEAIVDTLSSLTLATPED